MVFWYLARVLTLDISVDHFKYFFFSTQKDQAVGTTCHTHVQLSQPSLAQGRFDLPEWAGGVEPAARGRQAAPELVDKLLWKNADSGQMCGSLRD